MDTTSPLARKLRLAPGQRVLLLEAPDGYLDRLGPLPEGVDPATEPDGHPYDLVHLFVRRKADLDRLAPVAIAAVRPGGLLWISYPKQRAKVPTDLNRDAGWAAVDAAGWIGVAQVAVDEVWSALRFRPVADVKNLTRRRPVPAPTA